MYSYMTETIINVERAIENYPELDFSNIEETANFLSDELWADDSVTGNGSGSYTMNRAIAKANLEGDDDAMYYISEASQDFGFGDKEVGKRFLAQDWEWFDVTIRCYLLNEAIWQVVQKMAADRH